MENPEILRLASYNVRKCIGLDRRRRPERVIEVINAIGADVIALQEADKRLGERPAALPARLIEEETDFWAVPVGTSERSLGWHGNAVLVRKGLPVTHLRRIELPGTEPRGAVAVEIGGRLRFVAVHLGLLRRDRTRQLKALRAALDGADARTAILGDFNEWSDTRGLEPLEGAFAVHSPGASYHAARPVAALDRVALGAGLELRDAGVIESGKARYASDHLPIWADVRPARREARPPAASGHRTEETWAGPR